MTRVVPIQSDPTPPFHEARACLHNGVSLLFLLLLLLLAQLPAAFGSAIPGGARVEDPGGMRDLPIAGVGLQYLDSADWTMQAGDTGPGAVRLTNVTVPGDVISDLEVPCAWPPNHSRNRNCLPTHIFSLCASVLHAAVPRPALHCLGRT